MIKEMVVTKINGFKKVGKQVLLHQEQSLRQAAEKVFDQGLDFLGHRIMLARKAKEAVVAETHRKSASVPETEETLEAFREFLTADPTEAAEQTYEKKFPKDKMNATTRTVAANRKRHHSAGISRSH
jgi:hypothetical protein